MPGPREANGITPEEMSAMMELINALGRSPRALAHAIIHPGMGQSERDAMQQLAEEYTIGAWKVYTLAGRYRSDGPEVGIPFIEQARTAAREE
jgi:hypothetical protein